MDRIERFKRTTLSFFDVQPITDGHGTFKFHRFLRERLAETGYLHFILWFPYFILRLAVRETIVRRRGELTCDQSFTEGEETSVWEYGDLDTIHLGGTSEGGPVPEVIQKYFGCEVTIPRPFVCEIQDVELFGAGGRGRSRHGNLLLKRSSGTVIGTTPGLHISKHEEAVRKHILREDIDNLLSWMGVRESLREFYGNSTAGRGNTPDTVCPLIGPSCLTYGHWLMNYLPRLQGVERYEELTGRRPTLLLHPHAPEWVERTLRLVGYSSNEYIRWDSNPNVPKRTVIPSHRYISLSGKRDEKGCDVFSRSAFDWLRERMVANSSDSVDTDFSSRIYVSRNDVSDRDDFKSRRRVVNEAEVVEFLESRGFERYFPVDLTIEEQVNLFAQADTVVSPHGSAFGNLIFSRDARVVELFGAEVGPNHFSLARSLGLEYSFLLCEPRESDMVIDTRSLGAILDG